VGNDKSKTANTDTDNLVSNLRAEVGGIVSTFILMREFKVKAARLHTGDLTRDTRNEELNSVYVLKEKLEDEIVARLSELAGNKIGRINFFFAAEKLGRLQSEAAEFSKYVKKLGFQRKRNHEISHKELPEKWEDHRAPLHIPYRKLLRAVCRSLRLMKQIDRYHLGPSSLLLWREMRKRRYGPSLSPPGIDYMLLPHLRLDADDRIRIVQEEAREGIEVWSEMSTTINGIPTKVPASRKWGVLLLGDQYLALEAYPLVDLTGIQLGPPWQPFYEERTIQAKYRCKESGEDKLSFEPVERQHQFPDGSATELVDINVNLNDEIRKSIGAVNVGDVKDFGLNVRVLAGFEVAGGPA
jgi:hypothetical protein